jgi:hypothetical protein
MTAGGLGVHPLFRRGGLLTTRVSSELARVSSELTRVSSELTRVSSELNSKTLEWTVSTQEAF